MNLTATRHCLFDAVCDYTVIFQGESCIPLKTKYALFLNFIASLNS